MLTELEVARAEHPSMALGHHPSGSKLRLPPSMSQAPALSSGEPVDPLGTTQQHADALPNAGRRAA